MTIDARGASWPAAEISTIGAVGTAHFASHILQLAFAPLFIMMRADLSVSFLELGMLLSAFYLCSGAGQVAAGVLVDRFGAHRLLLAGLLTQGAATAAMGFAPHYGALLLLAAIAGLGNSVYHPADLSILSHRVAPQRLGRAFAAHVIAGSAGFALSPIVSGALGAAYGWRTALAVMGTLVVLVGLLLTLFRGTLETPPSPAAHATGPAQPLGFLDVLAMPVILTGFLYLVLTAITLSGVQSFSIVALQEGFGASVALATLAVALFQAGNTTGVAIGGHLADRTHSHHRVAMGGLAAASAVAFLAAAITVPPAVTVGMVVLIGFCMGLTTPSRDVLVRAAAPAGATGKTFGIVYSGYDVGSLVGPLIFGFLLDHHLPRLVFVGAAIPLALAIGTAFAVRRRPG